MLDWTELNNKLKKTTKAAKLLLFLLTKIFFFCVCLYCFVFEIYVRFAASSIKTYI